MKTQWTLTHLHYPTFSGYPVQLSVQRTLFKLFRHLDDAIRFIHMLQLTILYILLSRNFREISMCDIAKGEESVLRRSDGVVYWNILSGSVIGSAIWLGGVLQGLHCV